LLRVLPDAQIIATDLNQPMLDVARELVGDDPRLTWQQADAQALPVPDGSVDAVVCQFGLMFVPDKVKALREMKRVLSPGGIVLVAVWDSLEENPDSFLLHKRAREYAPDGGLDFMKTPFSMSDAHELERLATEAGLRGIRVETVKRHGEAESAAFLAHGFVRGNPLFMQLMEQHLSPDVLEAQVAADLAVSLGDKPCRTPLSAHVLTAFA
jgi:SAM-dependent methyltransferase